uniref:Uncharacterized protein n=1 Tax=viral metagenome TaxID=1070528 RepID=A0A6M3J7W3_9ZZZZ
MKEDGLPSNPEAWNSYTESMALAAQLDITPVSARRLMVLKERYPTIDHSIIKLDITKSLDSRIIDVMGWGPGGMGSKVLAGGPKTL